MKIAGFVPAKGVSSRVMGKNRQEIEGVPLYLWAANNLSRVLSPADIYVDSDAEEILDGARSFGFNVIVRPEQLATNATDGNELLLWEASNVPADLYLQHLPPMPFLNASTIEAAIEFVEQGGASAFTVHRSKVYRWDENGPLYDLHNIPNSFTLKDTIVEGMGFYATRRDALLEHRCRIVAPYRTLDMDRYEAVDIDYPEDLKFARTLALGLGENSPLTKGISRLRKTTGTVERFEVG